MKAYETVPTSVYPISTPASVYPISTPKGQSVFFFRKIQKICHEVELLEDSIAKL